MTTINQSGLKLIKDSEGCRLQIYQGVADVRGVLTIGYGHVCNDKEVNQYKKGITKVKALSILRKDLVSRERAIAKYVTVQVTHNMFSALVSFIFNIGSGQFLASTLLRKLNHGCYLDASLEFQRWIYSNGVPWDGLLKRRLKEAELFRKDIGEANIIDNKWDNIYD